MPGKRDQDYHDENNQKLLRGVQGGGFLEKSPPGRRRQNLYKTGDLARWQPDGKIEFLGRIDNQVKIRGFRIELGEIENRLLKYKEIKSAVVLALETPEEKYLCAYIVFNAENGIPGIRETLARELPEYMIPSYFVQVEKIPLTPNGKIDTAALPKPWQQTNESYKAPRNEIEKKLIEVWSKVLGNDAEHATQLQKSMGIDDNFFQLGGHSIKANRLTFRIYKELKVKIPLAVLFETPTIRGLSEYIGGTVQDTYETIKPVEKKEYYALSSSQKRMYILQQLDMKSIAYNMPDIIPLPQEVEMIELKELVAKLIKRHESLRTSFHMIGDQPVQEVHDHVEFEIENYRSLVNGHWSLVKCQGRGEVSSPIKIEEERSSRFEGTRGLAPLSLESATSDSQSAAALISSFIRPFDLSQAPLLRAARLKTAAGGDYLLVDLHHIISDGVSRRVLKEDFTALCEGKGLALLRIGYKDFAQWQNSPGEAERLQQQMLYWQKEYAGEIPVLELPTDNPRPPVQGFEGDILGFQIERRQINGIIQMAKEEGTTPFMVISTIYAILLAKLSGQEDIVIGIDIEGRRHAEIQEIIGMFVNALALRCFPTAGKTINEFLAEIKDRSVKAFENQDYRFDELVGQVAAARDTGRNPIFDVMLSYRDRETTTRGSRPGNLENLEGISADLDPYTFEWKTSKFDLTLNAIKSGEDLEFSFEYSTKLFREQTIRRYIDYFKQIVSSVIADRNPVISQLQVIPDREKRQLLFEFNDTKRELIRDKSYPRLYEEQAAGTPDKIAAVNHDRHITYNRLEQAANHIAAVLPGRGITVNRLVAIHLKRSIAMLAAIIGVFKAGAAYVPIDVTYPGNRTRQILEDSSAQVVITEHDNFDWQGRNILNPDPGQMTGTPGPGLPVNAPQVITQPDDLAYIIYTSGSTGKPKGVMIHRLGMINHLYAKINDLEIESDEIIAQTASACFDISVWQFLSGLLKGGTTCIIDDEVVLGERRFLRELQRHRVTILETVPSLMKAFLEVAARETDKRLDSLRWMIPTGEPLTAALAREWYRHYPGINLVNAYGPTETSDDVTHYILTGTPPAEQTTIPIGKPIQNTHIYILDRNLELCPLGVKGEICVAGPGVGKGYWKDSEKTKKAFIPNPYRQETGESEYAWLYKTGDIGYYREDGNIECLGRIDHQVKIRGNRIELEEIENQILNYGTVKNVVVIDKEDKQGDKYLCAYIAGGEKTGSPGLKEYLAKQLPGYMLPAFFVPLAELPLTPNGKIDRKALPEPREINMPGESLYIPPVSDKERKLAAAWEQVLGRKKIGIDENFFMIGGDSIKAIRIMSRMTGAGYKLEMRDLFQYPVIAQLANHIKKLERIPDQAAITGTIPLTPIQQAFFKESYREPHHYNLAVMLYSQEGFDKEAIRQIFTRIQQHHDALRMTYEKDEHSGKVVQVAHGLDYPLSLREFDIRNHENYSRELNKKINQIQAGINLEKGPLMKLGLFHLNDGDRLLIVIHHLVSDGVSWRILFEDIDTLFNLYKQGSKLALPRKTDSYKHWAEKLQEYANSKPFLKEKTYWQKIESLKVPPIPQDFPRQDNYIKNTGSESFTLRKEETELLLTKVNKIFKTEINDILLTALAVAIKKTFAQDRVLIALEGHGREAILEEMDVDRTVGWFTGVYPVVMDISYTDDPGRRIKEIKETLRRIPNKGIGYGILKYLTGKENKKEMKFKLEPQIGFNYMGQFDAEIKQLSAFAVAKEATGNSHGPDNQREYMLDVTGMAANSRLTMTISFDKTHFKPGTMKALTRNFHTELTSIIAYCSARENIEPTPGDFTYKGLSIENIDRLMKQYPGIEDIYTLTPMQEGMLYHALADNSSYTYFEQISYRLQGKLDINLVKKSLKELFKRHDILRTAFVYKEIQRPVQLVLKDRLSDFYYEDISKIGEPGEKENFIKEFKEKDKQRYFELSKDVLMRVTVFRQENTTYEFIWSFHHILMDGWCTGILNAEFLEIYYSYIENRAYRLPGVKPYRTYIQWLEQQEQEEAARYWEKYLESYEEPAAVPGKRLIKQENRQRNERISIELDRQKTAGINKLAAREQVTLNTVTQALWGILLGKYNGREDVVCGAVVSGRPSGLAGVEAMVGLFINTIPVRIRYEEKMKFNRLLQKVQAEALAGEPHHYHPLAEIQARTALKQNLIDHIFIFENYPIAEQIEGYGNRAEKPGLELTGVEVYEQTNYDFNVVLAGTDRLSITFQYDGNVYERDIVVCIARHFIQAVDQVIRDPELPVGEITLLSKEEKNRILYEFNETAAAYPAGKTIHRLYAEQAEQTPHRVALVGMINPKSKIQNSKQEGTGGLAPLPELVSITYRELNQKSNQLAYILKEKGIQPDIIVGIIIEPSVEMIIGIMGILKSGGAYLPIDPDYPRDRIDYMLKDSKPALILTAAAIAEAINRSDKSDKSDKSYKSYMSYISPGNHLAYIIYTSGTTGKPKGVLIDHGSIFNTIYWRKQQYKMKPGDRALQLFSIAFDGFLTSFFTPVVSGAMVVQIRSEEVKEISRVKETIVMMDITHFICVPSLYRSLMEISTGKELSGIKVLTLAGEPVHPGIIEKSKRMHPELEIHNEYGPTESSVLASYYGDMQPGAAILIGRPIANVKIYIIDKNINLVPIGITGEMAITGKGLARGYMNRPGLTAETFCLRRPGGALFEKTAPPGPPRKNFLLSDRKTPGKKDFMSYIYRTGDLARWLLDGNIEFIGRQDYQVKIRGYRIELGEIEHRLSNHSDIKQAVVRVQEEESGDKFICAYIVTQREIETAGLREFLLKGLPGYMIPSYFVRVEKIPLTPGGKIDRKALPKPGIEAGPNYTAPMNEIERKLVKIWSEVLGRDEIHAAQMQTSIGVHDDFFQLGGHSLKATNLAAKIHREFDVKVPVAEIFKTPTIREMAENIKGKRKDLYTAIEPVEEKEYYELSPAQKRLYILQQLVTENTGYNMPAVIRLPLGENVEKEELESVFKRLIARHESLRTSFITVKDRPVQHIHRRVEFSIGINELAGEEELETVISGLTRPFNLQQAPLLRVNLLEIRGAGRVLFIDMHHIITDGTSQGILEREFRTLEQGEELRPRRLRYKDYSQWDNNAPRQEALKQQESYWMKEFAGEIPVLDLPIDYPRPAIQGVEGNVVGFSLTREETAALKRIATENQSTLYMFLLAVMNVWLSKLSGQEDIIIGTPIAARRHADMQDVIGMLVNTLAMRNYPTGEKPFREFLKEVKRRTLDSYENQEYPFELLVEQVAGHRDTGRNPVFDVMFNMLNQAEYKGEVPDPDEQDNYRHKKATSKFDLNLTAMERGDRIFYTLEYSTRLFKPATIERLIGYYKNILKVLSRDTGIKISGIELMSKEDLEALLRLSTGIENDNDEITTVHRWYEEQAAKTPDHIALVGPKLQNTNYNAPVYKEGRGRNKYKIQITNHKPIGGKADPDDYPSHPVQPVQLTYGELNEISHRLAGYIKGKGAGPDSVIGLMAERSVEMIAGILAIMKTGGAYLPIDTEYPAERKRYMIREAGIRWLLVSGEIEDMADDILQRREVIDLRRQEIYTRGNHNLEYSGGGTGLAYVIYTSGSTGKPKGVMVEHRNLTNLLKYQFKHTNIDCTRVLQFSTISFDASFHEIFSAFLSGGRLYLVNKETRTEIPALFRLIEKNGIKTVFLPISFLKVIFKEDEYIRLIPRSIRHIQTAGDQVVINDNFRTYLREKQVHLHNHYGPSETHVVTTLTLDPGEEIPEIPSIGKPVMNTGIYILDKWGQLLPAGAAGEICLGGAQVGRGYLNRPELTAEKFHYDLGDYPDYHDRNHRSHRSHQSYISYLSYYKTGDLARYLSDGNIEFLGRIDHQVKIRGFRVEPGEIESRISNYPGIKEVVVMAREDGNGDKYICAYVVSGSEDGIPGLREHLAGELPEYMLPSYFIRLDRIPLTPNRKVDRAALPEPALKVSERYTAPGNKIEKKLVELWAGVLARDLKQAAQLQTSIGIDDNFFQLGGHSLKATILAAKIHKEFEVKVPLVEVFKAPRIRELARYIKERRKDLYTSIEPVEKKEYYLLSSAQKRLYILARMNPDSTAYNMPEVIPLTAAYGQGKIHETFKELIECHENLRTSFHMVNDLPVQKIHEQVNFEIENKSKVFAGGPGGRFFQKEPPWSPEAIIKSFIRPFDLTRAPLLRVGLLELQPTSSALRVHPRQGTYNSQEGEGHKYLLLVDMPHIISDGVTRRKLVEDFIAGTGGRELPLPRLQYKDYVEWNNQPRQQAAAAKQETYWLHRFQGEIPVLKLPIDYARPQIQSFAGTVQRFIISEEDSGQLKELALKMEATLYMVLMAIYGVFLYKVTGQEDVVIGTGTAGRRHHDLQDIMGIFVNTLAIRSYPGASQSFQGYLQEVKNTTLEVFENQEYPFEELVEKVEPRKDTGRNPLFDTMLMLQNIELPGNTAELSLRRPGGSFEKPPPGPPQNFLLAGDAAGTAASSGITVSDYAHGENISKFDMTLFIREVKGELHCTVEYCTRLFKPGTIREFINSIKEVAAAAAADPGQLLKEITRVSRERKAAIIRQLNRELQQEAAGLIEPGATLQNKIKQSIEKFPGRVAIEKGEQAVTYNEISRKAAQIAQAIIEKGIPRATRIGILMENRQELIAVMLGVLDAGAVFVPLEGTSPRRRLDAMIRAAGIGLLVIDSENDRKWDEPVESILYQGLYSQSPGLPGNAPQRASIGSDDCIYIYFTSGTTGTPRAMMGKNRGLLHFINWEISTFGIKEGNRISQLIAPVFDAFLRDVFVPLISGGVICIPQTKEIMMQSSLLTRWVERAHIHLIHCVPSLFRLLVPGEHREYRDYREREALLKIKYKELKYILLSGERINPGDLSGWYEIFKDRIQLVNLWGTSETTLAKTYYLIRPEDINRERIPVGKPLPGARVVVLDENLETCDTLVKGQLYIKTPFRTLGYHNEPALNRERFIPDPFTHDTRILLHKTGDQGRVLADGTIDVTGRDDRQVKIHGIRVELEEIESVLSRHERVKEVVVQKRKISETDELLCAYITETDQETGTVPHDEEPHPETTKSSKSFCGGPGGSFFKKRPLAVGDKKNDINTEQYRLFLSERLPSYMVPGKLIILEKMPRKPNGKVDDDALPDPLAAALVFQKPRDTVEKKLQELWSDILKREKEQISVTHSFFELGGNSLHIMTLIARIHRDFEVRVPLADVFLQPTIEKQAVLIRERRALEMLPEDKYTRIQPGEDKESYRLSSAQKRLYVLNQMEKGSTAYNMPEMIFIREEPDVKKLEDTFKKLIKRHESLRTSLQMIDGQPLQKVHREVEFNLELHEMHDGHDMRELIKWYTRPFDLAKAPLIRAGLIKGRDKRTGLIIDMHHIITDGISQEVLKKDFMSLYTGIDLPPLRIRYRDFCEMRQEEREKESHKRQEEYWQKVFAGEVPVLELPTDYPRPARHSFEGNNIDFEIPAGAAQAIKAVALPRGATLFMVLAAAFNILLSKLTGQEDIVIGTPAAGRRHAELEKIIGMFVNTLALRSYPAGERTFAEYLDDLKETVLNAFENQDYPFEELVEKLPLTRNIGRNPLFDIVFVMQNMETGTGGPDKPTGNENLQPQQPGKPGEYENIDRTAKFDITLTAVERNPELKLTFQYCTQLFKKETIERYIIYFKKILALAVENPGIKLKEIEIITEAEKKRLMNETDETGAGNPAERTNHRLNEEYEEYDDEALDVEFDF